MKIPVITPTELAHLIADGTITPPSHLPANPPRHKKTRCTMTRAELHRQQQEDRAKDSARHTHKEEHELNRL